MEKKKLLFVAISVGIFLVITIGAGIWIVTSKAAAAPSAVTARRPASAGGEDITVPPPASYQSPAVVSPGNEPQAGAVTGTQGAVDPSGTAGSPAGNALPSGSAPVPVDPVDIVRNSGGVPGLTPPPEGTSAPGGGFRVSGTAGNNTGQSGETRISVARPSTAAVPDTAPAGRAVSSARPAETASRPVQAAPTPPAETAAAQPKKTTQTRVYNDYWVQTGAFSTVVKAEGVKETLASKGITSIVENRQIDGKDFFRVRVGPYTSQNEADYWLSLIRSIDGFEQSQVRQTQSRR